jgi:dTMP kinase
MKYYLIEGLGGSGKTTLIKALMNYLEQIKQDVKLFREPGGFGDAGEKIRDMLLYSEDIKTTPVAQMFLFLADRALNFEKIMKPLIPEDKIIIQDRGFLSTLVYQGVEFGLDPDYVHLLHKDNGLYNIYPDKVILIDADAEVCYERLINRDKGGQHNFNRVDIEKLKKRRRIYLDCAKKYIPEDKLVIIDNNQAFDKSNLDLKKVVHNDIFKQFV